MKKNENSKQLILNIIGFMKKLASLLAACFLASCTYSINMAHTQGTATGTISDADSAAPDIAPALTIPLTTTPKV